MTQSSALVVGFGVVGQEQLKDCSYITKCSLTLDGLHEGLLLDVQSGPSAKTRCANSLGKPQKSSAL